MQNNKVVLVVLLCGVALGGAACSSDKKPPLKGDRISVLQMQNLLTVDQAAQAIPVAFPAPVANMAWPQAGGNAIHAPYRVALGSKLNRAWSTSIGDGSKKDRKLITAPIVADGRVYTSDTDGEVVAIDANKGGKLWKVNVLPKDDDSATVSPGLAYGNGELYVTDGIGNLLALNPADGKQIWHQNIGKALRGSPTVQQDKIYVITLTDETVALDAKKGDILWRHQGIQESAGLLGSPSPAAEGSVVITAYSSGDIVALRSETGQEAWSDNLTGVADSKSHAVTTLSGFHGHPVLDQDTVIVGNAASKTVAINVPSGERTWQKEFGAVDTPWVAGNVVFLVTPENEVIALMKDTGQVRWTTQLERYENPTSKEGLIFWQGPIFAGDFLYVAGSNEQMLAINPETGKIATKYNISDNVMLPPVVANNTLYVLTDDGTLVAYK